MSGHVHLAALLGLPGMGPRRLGALLDEYPDATAVWEAIAGGRLGAVPIPAATTTRDAVVARWRAAASAAHLGSVRDALADGAIDVLHPSDPRWPAALLDDPEPPPLLFARGEPDVLGATSAAIVGTRRCTASGAATAAELGEGLAAAGVHVVSGLAAGIDAAAHRGALRAGGGGRPIGVVATGLDRIYPRRNAGLVADVIDRGVVVSEYPPGTVAERWRFPARNRIVAALSSAVIVVESRTSGGSMHTVDAAEVRNVEVMAVPGSVRSGASAGTNALLAAGAHVARHVDDVLSLLGLQVQSGSSGRSAHAGSSDDADPPARGEDVLPSALVDHDCSIDELVEATGLAVRTVIARLTELEATGAIERTGGGYRRRIGANRQGRHGTGR